MALVLIETQGWMPVDKAVGNTRYILISEPVTIKNTDGSAATTYATSSYGSPSTASQVTDSRGVIAGRYIEEGTYNLTVQGVARRVEAIAGGGGLRVALSRQPIPVADRAAPQFAFTSQLSDGTVTAGTSRIRHTATVTCRRIVCAFSNWYNNNGTEQDGPQDITVSFSVEPATTKIVQGYFGGQRSVVIKPGGTIFSDPIGVNLARGQLFFTRTYISIATAATKFPQGGYTTVAANGEGHNYAVGGADLTAAGAGAVPTTAARVFSAAAVLGLPMTPGQSVVGIVGDSISGGTGDTGTWLDGGWVLRALNLNYSFQQVSMPSQVVDGWYAQEGLTKSRQQSVLETVNPTHLICALGVNGLSAGAATWQSLMIGTGLKGAWSVLQSFGVPLYQTTITPQTTSTDSWATVINQTVANSTNETARLAINDWLRDGAPITAAPIAGGVAASIGAVALRAGQSGHPLAGVIEVADLAESARNSGKWNANYTSDGTHPNATGAAALAAAITPTTLFGSAAV
jgi:lysophospholipase L1-like esterase